MHQGAVFPNDATHVGYQLVWRPASFLTPGDRLPAGASHLSTLISGNRLLDALMTCCSTLGRSYRRVSRQLVLRLPRRSEFLASRIPSAHAVPPASRGRCRAATTLDRVVLSDFPGLVFILGLLPSLLFFFRFLLLVCPLLFTPSLPCRAFGSADQHASRGPVSPAS